MKFTKYFKPYTKTKKCTLQKTGAGVYIIRLEKKIVYVGFSSYDVKKTMYRHFQKWTDKRHPRNKRGYLYDRVTYKEIISDVDCKVYFCTPKQAAILEQQLIIKLYPEDNTFKIDLFSNGEKRAVYDALKKATQIKDEEIF